MHRAIFLVVCVLTCSPLMAKKEAVCPDHLTSKHLEELRTHGEVSLNDVSFLIDGASEKKLKSIDIKTQAPFSYERTDSHKLACWYECNDGYLCVREK
ncbi:MAG: hypothetical protein LCH26_05585 [Proteobacteria bacterium]|nr:hypothetical protein [Pseudomonadota bacterium]